MTHPQNEASPDVLHEIENKTDSFIAAVTDASPHVRRVTVRVEAEVETETGTSQVRYHGEYVSSPPRPGGLPDPHPGGTPSGRGLSLPEDDRVTRLVIRYANERRRFFHITELRAGLAALLEGDPAGFDLELPGSRTVRKALEELRERGDLARSVYADSTQHHFHGIQDCVRIGPSGPEYASPDVAPPAGRLTGVKGARPVFDYVEGWPG